MLTSQNFFTTWCTFTKNHLKHRFDNIERAYMNQRNCFAPACPSSLTNNSECIGTFYHLVHNESPETQCFDNLVRVREGQEVCLPPTPKTPTPTPKTSHFQVYFWFSIVARPDVRMLEEEMERVIKPIDFIS